MAFDDEIEAATVHPVVVGFLDFATDPVRGWTGPGTFAPTGTGDSDLDGETFVEAESGVEISDFIENQAIGGPLTVSFAAADLDDAAVFQQIVNDKRTFQGKRAKFWRFFLAADEASVGSFFSVLFNGVMVSASMTRKVGAPPTITIVCDQDTQGRSRPPLRWIDHQYFFSTDTASTFMNDLERGGIATAQRGAITGATPFSQRGSGVNRRYDQ